MKTTENNKPHERGLVDRFVAFLIDKIISPVLRIFPWYRKSEENFYKKLEEIKLQEEADIRFNNLKLKIETLNKVHVDYDPYPNKKNPSGRRLKRKTKKNEESKT